MHKSSRRDRRRSPAPYIPQGLTQTGAAQAHAPRGFWPLGTAEDASVELCSASKNGAPPPALRPQLCPGTRMAPGSGSLRLAAEQARTDPDWLSFPHPGATESRDPRGVSTRRMRGGHGGGTRARRRLGDDTHQRYVATTHRVRAVLHALCRQSAATRLPNRQHVTVESFIRLQRS